MKSWRPEALIYATVQAVDRLVGRGVQRRLALFVTGERCLWSELETLAREHLCSTEALSHAAVRLYGVSLERRGDYVDVAGR